VHRASAQTCLAGHGALASITTCSSYTYVVYPQVGADDPRWCDAPTVCSAEEAVSMRCPYCRHADSRVVDSREADDGALIRRRRACPRCGRRFTTVEEAVLAVVKRSGVTEPFSRLKIISGVRKACQGRPVDEDAIALLAQRVEETIRARGAAEVPSQDVGLAALGPLRDLDEVAYLRFASVYRSFDSLSDFEREIAALRGGETASAQQPQPQPQQIQHIRQQQHHSVRPSTVVGSGGRDGRDSG
jgi:transcriptional repressor NrdR